MTFADWISEPTNWVFIVIGIVVLFSGFRVVTAKNVVHAALFLVGALAGTAGLFLLLSAEFVAWVLVLVYIGAVIVLFLFGIMITRAPTGHDEGLDSQSKALPALMSLVLFGLLAWSAVPAFGSTDVALVAALIGGITIARRDLTPLEEEERAAV